MTALEAAVENPFAGQGSVLLDIGGDIGALVVTMPSSMVGDEVDIRPLGSEDVDDHGHDHSGAHSPGHTHTHGHGRPHVAVVERPVPGGERPVACLVYPELVQGTYELLPKGTDTIVLAVDVHGGQVTTASWPIG